VIGSITHYLHTYYWTNCSSVDSYVRTIVQACAISDPCTATVSPSLTVFCVVVFVSILTTFCLSTHNQCNLLKHVGQYSIIRDNQNAIQLKLYN